MSSKKILVTGGAGYIGSHACKALARAGYTPVTLDNLAHGHPWAVKWGPFEVGDVSDRSRLDVVIKRHNPIAIMHLAAYSHVGESVKNPGKYYRNNVAGSLTLLEAARDHGIDKLIFSSTCATYGVPTEVPIREDCPQIPINPYGASKLMIERMLQDFDLAHCIRSVSLRYFNAAGADPEGEIGEVHTPETHLIPLALEVASGIKSELMVFGNNHDTPDGTCIRDYIHVSDLADAHVLALQSLERNPKSTAYNLANGKGYSVKNIIETIEHVTGKELKYKVTEKRDGDPPVLVGNSERIRAQLGWNPRHHSLTDIITTAWNWHMVAKSTISAQNHPKNDQTIANFQ